MKKAVNASNLLFAKVELAKAVVKAHREQGTIKTGRTLAALYAQTVGKFAMSRRYTMANTEYGEDYTDLANPAKQEAPPALSSRAGMTVPFVMPNPKDHEPSLLQETQTESKDASIASSDINFDEFGGWLV